MPRLPNAPRQGNVTRSKWFDSTTFTSPRNSITLTCLKRIPRGSTWLFLKGPRRRLRDNMLVLFYVRSAFNKQIRVIRSFLPLLIILSGLNIVWLVFTEYRILFTSDNTEAPMPTLFSPSHIGTFNCGSGDVGRWRLCLNSV